MEKIDIATILKDCPRGMELDCAIYDGVTLDSVVFESEYHYENTNTYPIKITTKNGFSTRLTKYGQNVDIEEAKCMIFPKGKTTWEGFVPPCKFKDGDICYIKIGNRKIGYYENIFIFKGINEDDYIKGYVDLHCNSLLTECSAVCKINSAKEFRSATEEEKQKLFKAIKDYGYKWNAETKTLEKLIEPKFKVGDIITNGKISITIGYIDDEYYYEISRNIANRLFIRNQDEWNLVPNKFDINILKPFDQVLVRLTNNCIWVPKFFFYYDTNPKIKCYPFVTTDNIGYPQCIPYKGNEHLCRKTDDCDNFYKTWQS